MNNDSKYILPIQDIGDLSGHEKHAATQIFQFLIAKFSIPQIAEILKHLGQQLLHYTQMHLEASKGARIAKEEMLAAGRDLDVAAGSGIILAQEQPDDEAESES